MISKIKESQLKKSNLLITFALLAFLFVIVGYINAQDKKPVIAAMELEKMNILYIGIDNPIKIAVAGIDNSKINVTIDNGEISGSNGTYTIRVFETGNAKVSVSYNSEVILENEFRVKSIPMPDISSN